MKQIVCGFHGTGKSHRSLTIAAGYEGTVLYYSGFKNAFSHYAEAEKELFTGYKMSADDAHVSHWWGKYFITPLPNNRCQIDLKEFYRAIEEVKGRLLLVIDDNAWGIIRERERALYYSGRTDADIIINLVYPSDLIPGLMYKADPYRYTEGWDLLVADKDHSFTPCTWENLFETPRQAAVGY